MGCGQGRYALAYYSDSRIRSGTAMIVQGTAPRDCRPVRHPLSSSAASALAAGVRDSLDLYDRHRRVDLIGDSSARASHR